MMEAYDVVVIGGGSAGYAAARTAREHVERVAIVDGSSELGGLCILRGCMPSKTLLYSAEVLHLAQQAEKFGLDIDGSRVDMAALHRRKRHWVDDFKSYRQEQLQSDRFTLLRDHGRFTGPDRLYLERQQREIRAERFIIATGSVPSVPAIPGLDLPGIWTSDDVLDLDTLPKSVIVLGGGVVACELSQFLQRIGTRVIQIQRSPHLLTTAASAEAADVVAQVFRREGIDLFTGTRLHELEQTAAGYRVTFDHDGDRLEREAAHVLNALGRRPAVDSLDLQRAGVATADNGRILVNEWQQSSNPRIFAAGDVCGPFEIVHIAIMQGEVAALTALGRTADPVPLHTRTSVTFTDPQVAAAGIPLHEAKKSGQPLLVADYPFSDHGKSLLMEAHDGFVRVWAEAPSGKIIGAEVVGKDGGELIHPMAVAISLGASATDLLKVHWYHPTLSEIWSYPLEEIHANRHGA